MFRELRQFFGVPQTFLAGFLRITRSQLSMAESGKRLLPTGKILLLLRFYKVMTAPAISISPDEELNIEREKQKLNKVRLLKQKIFFSKYEQKKLQKQLDKLQRNQERSLKVINLLIPLKEMALPTDKDLIEEIEYQARKTQKRTSEVIQLETQVQIQALSGEINFLESELKSLDQPI